MHNNIHIMISYIFKEKRASYSLGKCEPVKEELTMLASLPTRLLW